MFDSVINRYEYWREFFIKLNLNHKILFQADEEDEDDDAPRKDEL